MNKTVTPTLKFDTKDFDMKFNAMNDRVRAGILKGLGLAGEQLMNDSADQIPETPEDTGALKSSGSVYVDNRFHKVSKNVWHGHTRWRTSENGNLFGKDYRERPEPYTGILSDPKGKGNTATILFNKSYAAHWHENWPRSGRFHHVGSGIKYMEIKMSTNRDVYFKIIASEVRRAIYKKVV
jgi:hypothetical protein